MGEGGVARCGWMFVGVDCVGGQAWRMGVGVGGGGLTVAVGCIVVLAIRVRRVRGRRRAYCPAASSIIECMRYFFTVTVMLNSSVIFVTLIFVYAVNYCLIENSFDGHV